RGVDDLQALEVHARATLVRDLDELVGGRRTAGLDLGHDERRWWPGDDTGEDRRPDPRERDGHDEDDERGRARAPGTIHRRPPGGGGSGGGSPFVAARVRPALIPPLTTFDYDALRYPVPTRPEPQNQERPWLAPRELPAPTHVGATVPP